MSGGDLPPRYPGPPLRLEAAPCVAPTVVGRWRVIWPFGGARAQFFPRSLFVLETAVSRLCTRIKKLLMHGTHMDLPDTVLLVHRFVCDSTVVSGSQYIDCQSFAVGIQDR